LENKKPLKFFILFLTITSITLADFILAEEKAVVINEIAWMGTKEQWQNEWIELYNPNGSPVSLGGWVLKSKDDSPKIELFGKIGTHSYFLLERTDDTTVPEISADQIYAGGLNNNGEHLMLLNNAGEAVDEIDCALGWFSGSNETKKTMERLNPLVLGSDPNNWKMSQKSGGTPRAENSPQEKIRKEKEIETISTGTNNSDFSFTLAIGLAISLFFSMLILVFWLKIRQKRSNIR
jgi:hypothetical protein